MLRAHICDVIANGDPAVAVYIERWLAWCVQNPGRPAEVAIVLRGPQGAGKGVLGKAMCRLLGSHAKQLTRREDFLDSRFNSLLANCVFLFLDEIIWSGDKATESKLKGTLTEPTLRIEPKGVDSFEVRNCLHVLIATNESWSAPVAAGDRRYMCVDVPATRKGDRAYFDGLHRQLYEEGGLEAMLYDLLAMDLGDWHPRQIVETAEKRRQHELSLGPDDEWLLGLLEAGQLPRSGFDDGLPLEVATSAALMEDARQSVPVLRGWGMRRLSAALQRVGALPWRSSDTNRRTRGWLFLSLPEARARWVEVHGGREWPTDSEGWV